MSQRTPLPVRGASPHILCEREATDDFYASRDRLTAAQQVTLEAVVESFNFKAESREDLELPGTDLGTTHVRMKDGVYVLYQRFSGTGRYRFLVRLWYSGTYENGPHGPVLDFEKQQPNFED